MAEGKIHNLVTAPEGRSAPGADQPHITLGPAPPRAGRRILPLSFTLCVLLPTLLTAFYFAFVASDRYVAGAGFVLRGMDSGGSADLIGAVTGLASTGSTTSDSYILLEYLESRDILERLQRDFPFQAAYGRTDADLLYRLGQAELIEDVVTYWSRRIHTSFDATSGVMRFDVEAFTPDEALRIASLVLSYSDDVVNDLSQQARHEAVASAEAEVRRAEERLRRALDAVRAFRETEHSIDPTGSARIRVELIGELEQQLAETRASIASLTGSVDSDSPVIRRLERAAQALEAQITSQRSPSGPESQTEDDTTLSQQLETFDTLEVEQTFAQESYSSALASLEQARADADRQQRYLAVYSMPSMPEQAIYPRRLLNTVLVFAGLSLLWAIGTLVVYAVRDHLS